MKVWESGSSETGQSFELYEQPFWRWAVGTLAYKTYMKIPNRFLHPSGPIEAHGLPWQINFDLWMTCELPMRGRELIMQVDFESASEQPEEHDA